MSHRSPGRGAVGLAVAQGRSSVVVESGQPSSARAVTRPPGLAAKRWSNSGYSTFDWPQSVLERYPIRLQIFILVV